MTGSIVPLDGGRYDTVRYSKTLYDKGHGNTVVMHSDATCTVFRAAPAVVVAQPAAAPSSRHMLRLLPASARSPSLLWCRATAASAKPPQ
jgi:hypothetical protein